LYGCWLNPAGIENQLFLMSMKQTLPQVWMLEVILTTFAKSEEEVEEGLVECEETQLKPQQLEIHLYPPL
jgi:hypothetical protein